MLTYIRIAFVSLLAFSSLAQTKTLNYQAVILNPNPLDVPGNTISNLPYGSSDVCIKFSLQDKNGLLDYQEVQCTKTDAYGLVNVNIGTGNTAATQGMSTAGKYAKFDAVIWDANPKKLKVDVSFDQGKTFTQVSTQTLNYSAYALYAESVDYQNVRSAPTKLSQFTDDIQVVSKKDLDPIKADILKNKQDIQGIQSANLQTTSQVAVINQSITDINVMNDVQNRRLDQLVTQANEVNGVITNLNFTYERLQNKSPDTNLGGANARDGLYPSQRAVKAYVDAQTTPNATTSIAGKLILAGDLSGTFFAPTVPALTTKENTANKSTAANLGSTNPSDVLFPTQKAVKTYIDAQTTPEATTLIQGKVQLAGDLSGTASAPTVPALALKENLANKSDNLNLGNSTTLYPTQNAVKTYVDAQTTPEATTLIQGKVQLAGDLSGTASAPTVPALVLKENLSNKSIAANLGALAASDTLYPSQKAVKTYIDAQTTPNASTNVLGKIQLAGDLSGTATSPSVPGLALKENVANRSTAINLGATAPSDTLYPTQRAVKTYIDAQTTVDATTTTLGKIQLAGDLTGTAAAPRLATNAVKFANLADSTVTTTKIVDGNITDAKIASMQASKLTGNISVANGGTGVSTLTGMVRGNGTGAFSQASYGSFYDLSNQIAAVADSAVAMKLSNTDFASGISVQNDSQLRFINEGIYNIQFSAQLDRSAGTAAQLVKIWLRKNGVNVPASATEVVISGGLNTAATVASWNFFQNLAAGDQVELMWSVTNPQVYIAFKAATTSPSRPSVPSLIVTVNQVF
ncbi:MAG: hypothetical protein KA527_04815 [Cytophagaceae bacterium]|nr:hypothetical protein [Cytophagaceae bacterium]